MCGFAKPHEDPPGITTAEKPYSMLKQFGLLCCSPEDEIVLVHRKQNVVLRIPAPRRLDELHVVVADALKGFGTERAALEKRLSPVNWIWTHPTRLEHLHRL